MGDAQFSLSARASLRGSLRLGTARVLLSLVAQVPRAGVRMGLHLPSTSAFPVIVQIHAHPISQVPTFRETTV